MKKPTFSSICRLGLIAICLTLQGQSGSMPPPNTLVSGILLTQYGDLIPEDVVVTVYKDVAVLARVRTHKGLFSVDLAGKALPTDTLTLHVAPGPQDSSLVNQEDLAEPCPDNTGISATIAPNSGLVFPTTTVVVTTLVPFGYQNSHRGTVQKVDLAHAQNLNLKVDWDGNPFAWNTISLGPYFGGAGESSISTWTFAQMATCVYTLVIFSVPEHIDLIPQDYSCTDHS